MLKARQKVFEGPLPLTQINGEAGQVYRYGYGLIFSGSDDALRRHDRNVRLGHQADAGGRLRTREQHQRARLGDGAKAPGDADRVGILRRAHGDGDAGLRPRE